jgi:hypothetical protein
MIISDLSYLEAAPEVPSVLGGYRKQWWAKFQQNQAIVTQVAVATSVAVAINGNAVASAKASNFSVIGQNNS